MVQCELCGSETGAPKTIKIEGAQLEVCDSCADLGSEVRQSTQQSSPTKYSTSSAPTSSTSSSSTSRSSSGESGRTTRGDDLFDSLGNLAQDYDQRIRDAREARGMSQAELADELNEKRSLINRLERAETLPSDAVQSKLERYLEIDLASEGDEAADWEGKESGQTFTLGEMAERKD